jgi:hypothetical protein
MNNENIAVLFALIGIVFYIVIGRTAINLLDEKRRDHDEWRFLKVLIFPIVIVWEAIVRMSNHLTDSIIRSFDDRNKSKEK